MPELSHETTVDGYIRRHLRVGWWSLFAFTAWGLILESLHGFKVPAYLDGSNEARRLMWTLAHSHGTLLSVLNIVLALNLRLATGFGTSTIPLISRSVIAATVLLPGGFLAAGVVTYQGDPGLAILIVPFGAFALLLALFLLSRAAGGWPILDDPITRVGATRERKRNKR